MFWVIYLHQLTCRTLMTIRTYSFEIVCIKGTSDLRSRVSSIILAFSEERKYLGSTCSSKMSLSEVIFLIPCGKLNAIIFIFGFYKKRFLSLSIVFIFHFFYIYN